MTSSALDLFGAELTATHQARLADAEKHLLRLADHAYLQTSLKPMSKVLFLISRCLLVVSRKPGIEELDELIATYRILCDSLGAAAPRDDFSFSDTAREVSAHIPYILRTLERVRDLTAGTDSLGLAFDTLLRGKWESGEGLGTFLTPEEVVGPMVSMAIAAMELPLLELLGEGDSPLLFGDICGGTGRFVYRAAHQLEALGVQRPAIERSARLYDQSCMAVDLGKLNFVVEGLTPAFDCVQDSLTDASLNAMHGRFALLITNPPFGSGKYPWSKAVTASLSPRMMRVLGLQGEGSYADPALLFTFRNLDLLAEGGTLGIVLPDGIVHSSGFHHALLEYEKVRDRSIEVRAIVSLPSATFALGGTVAKTSFVIVSRATGKSSLPLYSAAAKHVGFKKRGNRRVADPMGNELVPIVKEFCAGKISLGTLAPNWRTLARLSPAAIEAASRAHEHENTRRLGTVCDQVRTYCDHVVAQGHFHISILDVDETGLIDIIAASRNAPITRSVSCMPGDIIVSCLNPKIWRVAVIPDIGGIWTCSGEFLVLRPKRFQDPWELFVTLHDASVRRQVEHMAGGTSSSRQRVPKSDVLHATLPAVEIDKRALRTFVEARRSYYSMRLREALVFTALHEGKGKFDL